MADVSQQMKRGISCLIAAKASNNGQQADQAMKDLLPCINAFIDEGGSIHDLKGILTKE